MCEASRQPTMNREYTSTTNAAYPVPVAIGT
jgi:hypothetical protein